LVTRKELREELERFATKEELRKELERFATKDDLKEYATKRDLEKWAHEIIRHTRVLFEDSSEKITHWIQDADVRDRVTALEKRADASDRRHEETELRLTVLERQTTKGNS